MSFRQQIRPDGTTMELSGGKMRLKDRGVTPAKIALPTQMANQRELGNLWIEQWATSAASRGQRWTFLQKIGDPSRGIAVMFYKCYNVWVVWRIVEGQLVPAYHFGPPTTGGAYATSAANEWTVNRLTATAGNQGYIQWAVPASANGMDTLLIYSNRQTNGGTAKVQVNGVDVAGGSFSTLGSSNYMVETSLTLATPLASGDMLKIVATGTDSLVSRMYGAIAYDSTRNCQAADERHVIGSYPDLVVDGSVTVPNPVRYSYNLHAEGAGMECAFRIRPTGSGDYKWIGSVHQSNSGANGSQVSIAETWDEAEGTAWTIAVGYKKGSLHLKRDSTVEYSSIGPVDLGTMIEDYWLTGDAISFRAKVTTTDEVDSDSRYIGMLPAVQANNTYFVLDDGRAYTMASLTDTPDGAAGASHFAPGARIDFFGSYGASVMTPNFVDPPVYDQKVLRSDVMGYYKLYWDLDNSFAAATPHGLNNAAIGTSWEGGWTYYVKALT